MNTNSGPSHLLQFVEIRAIRVSRMMPFVLMVILFICALTARAEPLDHWVLRHPAPTLDSLQSVSFLNDRFFALGRSGSILSSLDGSNWSVISSGIGFSLAQAAYGNGLFIAVGDASHSSATGYQSLAGLAVSTNGVSWVSWATDRVPPLTSITFGQGLFVAVGRSSGTNTSIWTTRDGQQWVHRALPFPGQLISVAFSNGDFLAVGGDLQMFSPGYWTYSRDAFESKDGANWTWLVQTNDRPLFSVTAGAGVFFAQTGVNSSVVFLPDSNGQLEMHSTPQTLDGAVGFGADEFKMLVYGPAVTTSADGITWTAPSPLQGLDPDEPILQIQNLAYGKGTWVGVGPSGMIATSVDGQRWIFPGRATSLGLAAVAEGNGLVVAVGGEVYDAGSQPAASAIVTSPDGVAWTKRKAPTVEKLASIAFGAGTFVAVGGDEQTGDAGTVLVSTNAIDWATPVINETVRFTRVVYGNGLFAAIGRTRLISSSDGRFWQTRLKADGQILSDLAYGAGRFVLSSFGPNGSHVLYASTDFTNWEGPFVDQGAVEEGLAFGQGHFRVPGYGPGLLVAGVYLSADGRNWDMVPTSEPQPNPLAAIPGGFVGLLNTTNIVDSTDGVHWNPRMTNGLPSLSGLAYAKGAVFAVGPKAVILESGQVAPRFLILGPGSIQNNKLTMTLASDPGDRLGIDFSPDLMNWSEVGVTTNGQGGAVMTDSLAKRPKHGFYRAKRFE